MTVDSGQTAYMQAGQELPVETAEVHQADVVVTRKLVYKPIGVQLHVTPQATGTDSVKLHVVTSLSAVSGFSPLPTLDSAFALNQTLVNPMIDSREAITHVTIKIVACFGGVFYSWDIGKLGFADVVLIGIAIHKGADL